MSDAMTLRDQFAAAILPAIYSDQELKFLCEECALDEAWLIVSNRAYQIADAMLIARQKDNQK
jgi:hypothetical protein